MVHMQQFNGKQEVDFSIYVSRKCWVKTPTCAAPATVKRTSLSGSAFVTQPLITLNK